LKKGLKLAWILDDSEYEISFYDLIGINFYYTDNIDIARYFHTRSVRDLKEPKDSQIKQMIL